MDPFRRTLMVAVVGLTCWCCGPESLLGADRGFRPPASFHPPGPTLPKLQLSPGPIPPRRGSPATVATTAADAVDQAIAQCVGTDMVAVGAPGAAVTVILDGSVIFSRGFGVKRLGHPDPVNADTRFRIGSVTKMLTAAAVMRQVDAGLVDLDAPITDWIPELELSGRWSADTITARHLLTHSAAVPDEYRDPFYPVGDSALARWAANLEYVRLHAPPGTFWNYSNPGFALAGLVAERTGGLPYRELMRVTVFDPAGMDSTTFDPAEATASGNFSYGHDSLFTDQPEVYAPASYDSWLAAPSGLAFSTAPDLARWAMLLMNGGGIVLSSASATAMQKRQIYLDHVPDLHYGFGVFAEVYKGLDVRQHGGNIPGWGAWLLWVPDRHFVVSILANTTMSLSAAAYCIVDAVLAPAPTPPVDYSTDPATWARYAGSYRLVTDEGFVFDARVRKTENRFFISVVDPDHPTSILSADLVQRYLDTFVVDDGGFYFLEPDLSIDPTLTFISRETPDRTTMWLRNRGVVGERLRRPRRPAGRLVSN